LNYFHLSCRSAEGLQLSRKWHATDIGIACSAAQAAVRRDPDWRRRFVPLAMRRDRRIAKVAMARRLAISLYWMWRKGYDYQQSLKFGSHAGEPGYRHGVK